MVKNNFYNDGRPIRFANIMLDAWFKRAFGNPDKPRLTLLLLQLLLPERNIQEINILPSPEHVNPFPGGKDIRVDVECISGPDGSRFIVEMQLAKQADYYDRAVYYSSFAIQQQLDKGDIRFCFPPVYHIGILNFALHPGESRVLFRYNLQEDTTHEIMTDHLNYLFLELPNGRVPDGTTDRINDFCYYLREMANLQEEPEDVHDELLRLLFNSADYRIFSPEEKTRYERI